MRPRIQLLSAELIERILGEAFQLLSDPGVRVAAAPVELLRRAGVEVRDGVARLPEALVRQCVASVPREFFLYNRRGKKPFTTAATRCNSIRGRAARRCWIATGWGRDRRKRGTWLDRASHRDAVAVSAQSTAVVCNDAAGEIGDLYRLWVVLRHSNKPVVTGSFSPRDSRE